MHLCRRAAALAAVTALCTAVTSAAMAAPEFPDGLYGTADPTYDGVWRQSYALLALDAAGERPADEAVDWLAGQQCADGGFASYRADTGTACDAATEDTNATGIAVQALAAVDGRDAVVDRAVAWLESVRNEDGGWSYKPGGASDANSTAVVIGSLEAAGQDAGPAAYEALRSFQLGCDAKAADRGAFAYQPQDGELAANAKATADAVRGAEGAGFVVAAPDGDEPAQAPDCAAGSDAYASLGEDGAADAGAAYLIAQLDAGDGHLTAVTPGSDTASPDYGTTADAVIALAAGGHLDAAKASYEWLAEHAADWSEGNPTALAQLALAAHATGSAPEDFVRRLADLGPAPDPAPAAKEQQAGDTGDDGSAARWWIAGAGLSAGIGAGFLVSRRRKRQG